MIQIRPNDVAIDNTSTQSAVDVTSSEVLSGRHHREVGDQSMKIIADFESCLIQTLDLFVTLKSSSAWINDFNFQPDRSALEQALQDVESARAKIGIMQLTLTKTECALEAK